MPHVGRRRSLDPESRRLDALHKGRENWAHWGPYLAERAWGSVREDYGPDGDAWTYFPHDHARSRAYRWNEDGLAGYCDENQTLCFGLALWNGQDSCLKERLFGLAGPEGNHGEDVKELYWYLDSTPTHSFASMRYRYPQRAFPYEQLRQVNAERGRHEPEFELTDTDVFDDKRYFDITVSYAKGAANDTLIDIQVYNAASRTARLVVLPQLWFRNTWSWHETAGQANPEMVMPSISQLADNTLLARHPDLGNYHLYWQGRAQALFTNNDSHRERLFNSPSRTPWVKDAFHRFLVNQETDAINPDNKGTKAGLAFHVTVKGGETTHLHLRLSDQTLNRPFRGFKPMLKRRKEEADRYFNGFQSSALNDMEKQLQRQALAGMLWSKQWYHYDVRQWLKGDPLHPVSRSVTRNEDWQHLLNADVISMPDTWEYPWYAVWDTAFHCLPLGLVDPEFARDQLLLFINDHYQHPNGQLPAYEWAFDDVNPPVHAWSALQVFRLGRSSPLATSLDKNSRSTRAHGSINEDVQFLESVFLKLQLNFSWWVNRKDRLGNHLYGGGFLGLDNISLFDRSEEPPRGGFLQQADGTAWMAFFAVNLMQIALELSHSRPAYEDLVVHYFNHYLKIAEAIHGQADHAGLWNSEDGFFYDQWHQSNGKITPLPVRSLVGLMPLIAATQLRCDDIDHSHATRHHHPATLSQRLKACLSRRDANAPGVDRRTDSDSMLLSLVDTEQLKALLQRMLDETEFLSPHGLRSLSKAHKSQPVTLAAEHGKSLRLSYEPAESQSDMFGGNSNWRGPVWFPVNYLLIRALRVYGEHYGDQLQLEFPTRSGHRCSLSEIADLLSDRLIGLFEDDSTGTIPWCGSDDMLLDTAQQGMHLFHEYFDGDTGRGLGANHQTGWTGLIAMLLHERGARTANNEA